MIDPIGYNFWTLTIWKNGWLKVLEIQSLSTNREILKSGDCLNFLPRLPSSLQKFLVLMQWKTHAVKPWGRDIAGRADVNTLLTWCIVSGVYCGIPRTPIHRASDFRPGWNFPWFQLLLTPNLRVVARSWPHELPAQVRHRQRTQRRSCPDSVSGTRTGTHNWCIILIPTHLAKNELKLHILKLSFITNLIIMTSNCAVQWASYDYNHNQVQQ